VTGAGEAGADASTVALVDSLTVVFLFPEFPHETKKKTRAIKLKIMADLFILGVLS
jgi:hypothetical protein